MWKTHESCGENHGHVTRVPHLPAPAPRLQSPSKPGPLRRIHDASPVAPPVITIGGRNQSQTGGLLFFLFYPHIYHVIAFPSISRVPSLWQWNQQFRASIKSLPLPNGCVKFVPSLKRWVGETCKHAWHVEHVFFLNNVHQPNPELHGLQKWWTSISLQCSPELPSWRFQTLPKNDLLEFTQSLSFTHLK